jgi:hypothetical protein
MASAAPRSGTAKMLEDVPKTELAGRNLVCGGLPGGCGRFVWTALYDSRPTRRTSVSNVRRRRVSYALPSCSILKKTYCVLVFKLSLVTVASLAADRVSLCFDPMPTLTVALMHCNMDGHAGTAPC